MRLARQYIGILLFALAADPPQSFAAAPVSPSLFGVVLNKPLTIPKCDTSVDNDATMSWHTNIPSHPLCAYPPTSQQNGDATASVSFGTEVLTAAGSLPIPKTPHYMSSNSFDVLLRNGSVQKVSLLTNANSQDEALRELIKKFGPPRKLQRFAEKTNEGVSTQTIRAIWRFGLAEVDFQGREGGSGTGLIVMATVSELKKEKAEEHVVTPDHV